MTATIPWGYFTCILITNPQNNPEKKYHCLHLELRKQNNWVTFPSPTTSERQSTWLVNAILSLCVGQQLLLLSHVSRVRLCATPLRAAHQAPFSMQEHWSGLPFPSPMHESEKWNWSRSVLSDSSRPHGLQPTRLLCPWDFPGKSTGMACHCLLWCWAVGAYLWGVVWDFKAASQYLKNTFSFPWILWLSVLTAQLDSARSLSSVQFSWSVVSDSLWPHGLQHTRLPCPSPTSVACSNSCPSSRWCHPTISPSVVPSSSCIQSCPASGSFPMSQFFTSCGQRIEASASASVLPMNIQDWLHLGWTGWISLQSKGLSRVFSNTTVQNHQFFSTQFSL